jgi:hypothetical protein
MTLFSAEVALALHQAREREILERARRASLRPERAVRRQPRRLRRSPSRRIRLAV